MTFIAAIKKLKRGMEMRRHSWPMYLYFYLNSRYQLRIHGLGPVKSAFDPISINDVEATDWEVG